MGEKVKGRKRHALVDTPGFLLDICIASGSVSDNQRFFSKLYCFSIGSENIGDHSYQGAPLKKSLLVRVLSLKLLKSHLVGSAFIMKSGKLNGSLFRGNLPFCLGDR